MAQTGISLGHISQGVYKPSSKSCDNTCNSYTKKIQSDHDSERAITGELFWDVRNYNLIGS